MAGPLDIDDDMQRMVLRKGEATAKGGHALQRLLQLAETRDSGQVRRVALFIAATYNGEASPSTCSSCARSTKPSATTCCCASTRCAGASPTCAVGCPTATGGEFGERRAVIDHWGLKWPEAH